MNPDYLDDMVSSYVYEEISKHPGHSDQSVHGGGGNSLRRRGVLGGTNARDDMRGLNEAASSRTRRASHDAQDAARRAGEGLRGAGSKAREAASRAGESARSAGTNARVNAGFAGSQASEKGRRAGRFVRDEARGAAGHTRSAGRAAGRFAGEAADAGKTAALLANSASPRAKATAAGLVGAGLAGAGTAVYRNRKKDEVGKAFDLYEEVEKFRGMPKMRNPFQKPPATQMPIPGMAKPTMGQRAAGAGRKARAGMAGAGDAARTAGVIGAMGARQGAQAARGGATRAAGAVRANPRRAAAIGAGAGAAAGATAYGLNQRKKKDQFGKADDVYELAKNFREARYAGEIGHEYDLTTDPELYSEIADRFVSKVGGDNFDTPDVDAVYADMGGDWVPVEDVLVELAKALYVGDDETAELIAYAIS